MIIHDHFNGSARCVECGGHCKLRGDDLAVTMFVRFTFEDFARRGWKEPWSFHVEALRLMGYDAKKLMRRAVETSEGR